MDFDLSKASYLTIIGGENDPINRRLFSGSKKFSDNYYDLTIFFVERARNIHGSKYNYNNTFYVNMTSLVTIECNKCFDIFSVIANDHLYSVKGECPCQYDHYIKNDDDFHSLTNKIFDIYSNKFECSTYIFYNKQHKIRMKCLKCNNSTFLDPLELLKVRYRCNKCSKKTITVDEFISKSKNIFGDIFDYSKVVDVRSTTKIKLVCNICGEDVLQISKNHLKGRLPYHFIKMPDIHHQNIRAERSAKTRISKYIS
ncbi:hypothetical protein [Niemeyer virus]|uniref:Uncharacterized protein n=1 Tax=Acanthamoeba polyphaga mimivirus Kroon TaxID=3069720 RepID=A0A0G2Y5R4_9VIRU|nr:hypothetical protein QJ850_gp775 [Acanthamoeba polyphaga mimivirus]AKI79924.1 hypothetical protein [Acanthamoeba polyphaga mimivirus Kroon]ALR83754.1 hypothetical protein [Niemeyer virus]